jgi:cation:H+ antiporter
VEDVEEDHAPRPLSSVWIEFALLGVLVGGTGYIIGTAGLSLASSTGLSGSLVGALFTSVVTSLPELVTVLAAVRIGALTLAVGDIIGGNSFDVLFVAVADVAFREGSIYNAADQQAVFLMAVTVVLTATLAAGMLGREERHIGFEGIGILVFYAIAAGSIVALG